MDNKILVTGATGQYGSAVIQYLLNSGLPAHRIAALARNPRQAETQLPLGIHIIPGDYDDYTSLALAFTGIDKLLFVPGRDLDRRLAQHGTAVRAAKEAHVNHFVYPSFARKNDSHSSPLWMLGEAHIFMEKLLKESGLTYTILKNNLYMDFIPEFIGKDILNTRTIYLPAGDGKVSAALRSDMAGAAAAVLRSDGHQNKTYDITNIEAYNYAEIAACLSDVTGKIIRYVSPSLDEFNDTISRSGLSNRVAGLITGFVLAQAEGDLDIVSQDLSGLLGRNPVSFKAYLTQVYGRQKK